MKTILLHMIDREQYDEDEQGVVRESTKPCVVNADSFRCFYPRKGARAGTRITFKDGGGFAVADTFERVCELIECSEHAIQAQAEAAEARAQAEAQALLPAPTPAVVQ